MFPEFYPYKETEEGVCLYLKVTPKAAQNRIGKVIASPDQVQLKVYVTAAPEDGKANLAVIELLASEMGIAKSQLVIIKGHTQHNKVCLIKQNNAQLLLALQTICVRHC